MSLFDRASASIQESEETDGTPLTEDVAGTPSLLPSDAEILGLQEDESGVLSEMLGNMHGRRYVNHRDLQYALEDAATTCERNWKDRKGYQEHKGMEDEHNALVAALREASAKARAYEDKVEAARKERREKDGY